MGGAALFLCRMEINVERIVEKVIAEYEGKGKAPAQCDLHDIIREIAPDITSEMRRLIKEGGYVGSITINKIPVLKRKE